MNKRFGINGFTLKMLAVVTMLIDHIGATIVERYLYEGYLYGVYLDESLWYQLEKLDYILRAIGRIAFPIYCYLIVEGFLHTRSVKKYVLRLFGCALLSEIPFDLAFNESLFWMDSNNVFWTLALGLLAITGIDYVDQKYPLYNTQIRYGNLRRVILMAVTFLVPCVLAYVLHTDYSVAGVLCIVIMYLARRNKMLAVGLGVLELGLTCSELEFFAFVILIPVYFYNGKQGPKAKWFFYLFYPVHLLILSGICYGLGLGI